MAKSTSIVYEDDLNRRHQEIVARHAALVEIGKKLKELDAALEALPDDDDALKRNQMIKKFCSNVLSSQEQSTTVENVQLFRHQKLVEAYEKMVKRELVTEKCAKHDISVSECTRSEKNHIENNPNMHIR